MTHKKDDIVSMTKYFRVVSASNSKVTAIDMENNEPIEIKGVQLVDNLNSSDLYNDTRKVTKTELVELMINAGVKPFTVVFTKQNGEKRIMRARFLSTESLFGRSAVSDLDNGFELKQVDHRTIESIIIDKVKYVHK
jgi:NMD protein affecting ribosome stability and mRNA decay